jgi:hypothetical protein
VDREVRRVRDALNMSKGILRKTVYAPESGQLNPKFVWHFCHSLSLRSYQLSRSCWPLSEPFSRRIMIVVDS